MTPETSTGTSFLEIPIGQALESATNPRKRFDQTALEELSQSIRSHGIRLPLLVRPDRQQPDAYEIVAGARRYRAATLAGLKKVPVLVRHMSDQEVLEVQVIENLQREDVHPLEEALGYQALMASSKVSVKEIAAKLGKSEAYVYQRMKLTDLSEDGQKLYLDGGITTAMAIAIARLQPKDQKDAVKGCTAQQPGGWRQIENITKLESWIESNTHLDLTKAPFDILSAELLPAAGACPACPKRTGFTPALFPTITNADTCTDKRCFNKKQEINFQATLKLFEGEALVQITENYWTGPKSKLVTQADYKVITGDDEALVCDRAVKGLIADGGRRGAVLDICADKKCPVHFNDVERSRQPRTNFAEENRKQAEKRHLERAVDARVAAAILAKLKPGRTRKEDLFMALDSAVNLEDTLMDLQGDMDNNRNTCFLPIKTTYELAKQNLKKVTEEDLVQMLLQTAVYQMFGGGFQGQSQREASKQAILRHKIDIAAITKQVRAELKAAAKAKPDVEATDH